MKGYEIKLDHLCRNQDFAPAQVVSSELVYPKGAVPNPLLMWVRVTLTNEDTRFITLPLTQFYEYVQLPESKLGGLVDGNYGSDIQRHLSGYALDDSGDSPEAQRELQRSSESSS